MGKYMLSQHLAFSQCLPFFETVNHIVEASSRQKFAHKYIVLGDIVLGQIDNVVGLQHDIWLASLKNRVNVNLVQRGIVYVSAYNYGIRPVRFIDKAACRQQFQNTHVVVPNLLDAMADITYQAHHALGAHRDIDIVALVQNKVVVNITLLNSFAEIQFTNNVVVPDENRFRQICGLQVLSIKTAHGGATRQSIQIRQTHAVMNGVDSRLVNRSTDGHSLGANLIWRYGDGGILDIL